MTGSKQLISYKILSSFTTDAVRSLALPCGAAQLHTTHRSPNLQTQCTALMRAYALHSVKRMTDFSHWSTFIQLRYDTICNIYSALEG